MTGCYELLPALNFLTVCVIAFVYGIVLMKIFHCVKRNEFNISQLSLKVQKAQDDGLCKLTEIAEKIVRKK